MVLRKGYALASEYRALGIMIDDGCPNNQIPDEDDEWDDEWDDECEYTGSEDCEE